MCSIAVDKLGIVGNISMMNEVALRKIFKHIPQLKLGTLVQTSRLSCNFPQRQLSNTDTQPCKTQCEHWIMMANRSHKLFFAE